MSVPTDECWIRSIVSTRAKFGATVEEIKGMSLLIREKLLINEFQFQMTSSKLWENLCHMPIKARKPLNST